MTPEEFERFKTDYLTWVAQERVRYWQRTQRNLQIQFEAEQRRKAMEYRQKMEQYKQLKLDL